ncbi:hypothetical protein GCM10011371_06200 [Novosphingobium marinum]|uniref:Membrane protein implicated in regulation of membrane protease activity n=1 Tax=Novosphingobium marinum TaxID=1514948 RepID=A0A7Z0BTP4_9SPHN|nr:hypothetical protein [Novosphingobium marinum]NYH94308.1 membrane protein implicated in regulation of membrane protease activity [Novosphingobium marinum]GGC21324.1 hypothetical protein GCM10011371_06200 [Novosphingobium marinum]
MKALRGVLLVAGALALGMGLLWIGQGLGLVMWPESSFMLADRRWAINGAVLAGVGLVLIWAGRRR